MRSSRPGKGPCLETSFYAWGAPMGPEGLTQINSHRRFPEAGEPLRILCFGAGAIGTYVGGSLAKAGNQVVFYDRPEVAGRIRQAGLNLKCIDGERVVPRPEAASSPGAARELGPYHLAILAVKAFDTAPLLAALPEDTAWLPPFLCLQNGVENESLVTQRIGAERVVAASVTTAIGRRETGEIVVERLRGIGWRASSLFYRPWLPG